MTDGGVGSPALMPEVRQRRAGLRKASHALERALAQPLAGRPQEWADQVGESLHGSQEAFAAHVEMTERPDGLYGQVRADAPRLAGAIRALQHEHDAITEGLARGAAELAGTGSDEDVLTGLRERLTATLTEISRHRQRGADLLYQAYQVDIGGE